MKAKLLCDGNDGSDYYEAGKVYTKDTEWIRRLLVNGLADPMDRQAEAIAADKDQKSQHSSRALKAAAKQLPKEV
jgi:type IV secretory pathway VirD2 relaxase